MESPKSLRHLYPLVSRRFRSFAEASEAALDAVAAIVPGTVVLGQAEDDGETWRVIDVRGAARPGIGRGTLAPRAANDEFEPGFLDSRGVGGSIALPLELSNGRIVGVLAALADEDDFEPDHLLVVGLAARMLGYEWERVETRVEVRELRQLVSNGARTDPETGLVDRTGFVELLDREWRLARRGTVRSMAVAFSIGLDAEPDESALTLLAVKDAAEVLAGGLRTTDHVGRTGRSRLAAILVGCGDLAGVETMVERYTDSLRRVTSSREGEITVAWGATALAEAESPQAALELAERTIGPAGTLAGLPGGS